MFVGTDVCVHVGITLETGLPSRKD